MNVKQKLYMCYRGLARTRSTFRDHRFQRQGIELMENLSSEEINEALLNILVRINGRTYFCVQLRIDDNKTGHRYYVGIRKRQESIRVKGVRKGVGWLGLKPLP